MKANKRNHDFKALELKLTEESVSPHIIYFKEHSVREQSPEKPSGRTLFVVNLPPYADEKGLTNAFHEAGTVHSVRFCNKPNETEEKPTKTFLPETLHPRFRIAYIVFKKVAQLDKALKLTKLKPMYETSNEVKLGMDKWIQEHNNSILLPKNLKENIEEFMKSYDADAKSAEEKEKQLEQEDDEGWVTVTKQGKVQSFARSDKVENKIMAKEEKNKKRKELKNFYTFQIRESKMKHIVALRQKFEEDKRKIAQIKQSRRFKPF
ncbi:PREDICTED: ribosomal RNA-processing protein 7 homolog A [Papilio xuthus]|uniref:Ribosomal RNA-processing protein 7 homolog A n=1 Tax=Papilio xuthus TaxID=66420 RepID=A0AAJ6ZG52_PAPXU|nr:PREDICTED: ribosomal RNA-processing protein 7 homolog A [Papilio xuthus]